jgi:hypothetical protein
MPKLTGPLFALEARQSMKKTITYQGRPSGFAVCKYRVPYDPKRPVQRNIRGYIAAGVAYWKTLPTYNKSLWNDWVK